AAAAAVAQTPALSPAGTIKGFTVGTSSTPILTGSTVAQPSPPPTTRRILWLHNPSTTASIWCEFGATAVVAGAGSIYLPPGGGSVLWGNAGTVNAIVPGDSLNCIASATGTPLTVEVY
ncbi:MAG TPA: hypothetical protein VME41_14025, partial [Stellaceae bacterium]|nr:hypothetical protein [Stellaceae bacterium]